MAKIATIGNFDGVHRGHQLVLDRLKAHASELGLVPVVMTFRRHPLHVIAPERAPRRLLSPIDERLRLLRDAGCEAVALEFDDDMRVMTARDFIVMLRDSYGVEALLLGFNNRIGYDRGLSHSDYEAIASEAGVKLLWAPEASVDEVDGTISSSRVRGLVEVGDVAAAREMLGRGYSVSGIVGHGKELGRTIGFPTANLVDIDPAKLLPGVGVYAAWAEVADRGRFPAMVNIGRRPTVDTPEAPLSVETHILDFDADIYGEPMRVEFVRMLRPEMRFPDVNALAERLAADRVDTLAALS